ncbi:arylalkylamine N-acetyltransferase-like 2 [Wyeomyia smithii]|uniref:arylalkylamine N-acetyltransferase-like 2 n=1 Tax=Wyeomyia smithii TaxID=174621 RepID=UPI002467F1B0|nr:arylalkylamine N-acetyltransferase-like 2 [Wyeomyia smithii]
MAYGHANRYKRARLCALVPCRSRMAEFSRSILIEYDVTHSDDYNSVLEFVLNHYYRDEPMNNSYIYGSNPAEDDVEFSVSFMFKGMAIKAVDRSRGNHLIGISIANPIYPGYVDDLLQAAKLAKTRKWSDSLKLLARLQQSVNVLERFNVPKCYDIEIVAVDPEYRGHSIGAKLFERQFERGRDLGYPLASADCSSYYSARIAERVGMTCVGRLAYVDYRDEHGVQLFQPSAPHLEIQTFAKRL